MERNEPAFELVELGTVVELTNGQQNLGQRDSAEGAFYGLGGISQED